jgi:DNA-binding protein HU-beta
MNKSDLIESMASNAGISKAAAGKALDAMMKSITGELMTGGRVSLVGFGSFSVSSRAARDGRNPQSGATIKIPARKVVKFKPGSELKDSVN